eukprot:TRINITY_DN1383_c0_g1_i1.p1 TRINITY_DN1383_c0_g1~~TRINITY_DN1383_c0_g1_i1.p1  ORF type:complete len:145 (+),score=58.72 TRINITY_DN1383_c0_g1_i1:64-498(+)
MLDVSDSSIIEAYQKVRSDLDPINWVIFGYDSNKLIVQQIGSTDFNDYINHFKDDQAQFGYHRVVTADSNFHRAKFVFTCWVGPNIGRLARARVSVHKADVRSVCRDCSVEIYIENKEDFNEQLIISKVKTASGADYGTGQSRI